MKPLLTLAARSAWNRRFVLGLVALSIALSTLLLLGLERLRQDVRDSFSQAVSGTDLIVGARTGPVQLLLYAVFRIGNATNNIRYASVQALAQHRAVAWVIPLSLGDSHRGFAVLGTSADYFQHFRHGDKQALRLAQGRAFDGLPPLGVHEAVLGAEVAQRLGYRLDARIVLAHGDGAFAANDHADQPFRVVGILAPTGTPVDRTVHISLQAMEALHAGWVAGMPPMSGRGLGAPGMALGTPAPGAGSPPALGSPPAPRASLPPAIGAPPPALGASPPAFGPSPPTAGASAPGLAALQPRAVTAALVGLKNRAAVFSVQREVAGWREEPLLAILPGVALDELWDVIALGERGLQATSALVAVVSFAGLVAVILAGLNERRRELAILRAVGAGPRQVLLLLALEGLLVTAGGVLLGAALCWGGVALLADWVQGHLGIVLRLAPPGAPEWRLFAALLAGGWLASLVPGWRAYRLSLADGLAPRV